MAASCINATNTEQKLFMNVKGEIADWLNLWVLHAIHDGVAAIWELRANKIPSVSPLLLLTPWSSLVCTV